MSFDEFDASSVERVVQRAKRRGRFIRHRRRVVRASMAAVALVAAAAVTTHLHGGARTRVSTSSPTTAPAVVTCQPSQVATEVKMAGGAGTVLVTNTSSSTCTLEGYPSLRVLNSSATSAEASSDAAPGSTPPGLPKAPNPALVTLAHGETAMADVGWKDQAASGSCVTPAKADVTLPGQTNPQGNVRVVAGPKERVCSSLVVEAFQFDQVSAPPTTVPVTTPSTTATAVPACEATQLRVSLETYYMNSPATLEYITEFVYTNTSNTACSLAGYSQIAVQRNGAELNGPVTHSHAGFLTSKDAPSNDPASATTTPLDTEGQVVELMETSVYPGCHVGEDPITITLPGSSGVITLSNVILSECGGNPVTIGPFQFDQHGYPANSYTIPLQQTS